MRLSIICLICLFPTWLFAGWMQLPGPGTPYVASGSGGNSDTFAGDQAALATHDSNWTASADGVANLEIDGSGNARLNGSWRSGSAYYNATPSDVSQITIGSTSTNEYVVLKTCVRMSGASNGYCLEILNNDGTDWGDIAIRKGGTVQCYLTGTYSASAAHTLKITASGTSTVTVEGYIDGTAVGSCDVGSKSDSTDPITSGYSGFGIGGGSVGDPANNIITDWQDYE